MKLATAVCIISFANAVLGAPTKPADSKDVGSHDSYGSWKSDGNGHPQGPPEAPKQSEQPSGGDEKPSKNAGKPSGAVGGHSTPAAPRSTLPGGTENGNKHSEVAPASTPTSGYSVSVPIASKSAPAAPKSPGALSQSSGYPAIPVPTPEQPSAASSFVISIQPTPSASQFGGGGKPSKTQPSASGAPSGKHSISAPGGQPKPSAAKSGVGGNPQPTGQSGDYSGGKGQGSGQDGKEKGQGGGQQGGGKGQGDQDGKGKGEQQQYANGKGQGQGHQGGEREQGSGNKSGGGRQKDEGPSDKNKYGYQQGSGNTDGGGHGQGEKGQGKGGKGQGSKSDSGLKDSA